MAKKTDTKSNKKITISKDSKKSYVYIKDGKKEIGALMWHYKKKKWIFEENIGGYSDGN